MQFGSSTDIEVLWKAFGDYVCIPYAQNPEHHVAMEVWFTELYARRETEGLLLSFCQIESKISDRRFNAFCLNKQIYFSDDVGVLTLHRPFNKAYATSRLAGIYLDDTLVADENWHLPYQQGIKTISSTRPFTTLNYSGFIFDRLKQRLSTPDLPQETTNHFSIEATLKVARTRPFAFEIHRDYDPMERFGYDEPCWSTALHYALAGPGTTYCIGNQENIKVVAPTRSMCAHLEMYVAKENLGQARGIAHYATGDEDGRAVAAPLSRLTTPLTDYQPSPWRISHQATLG